MNYLLIAQIPLFLIGAWLFTAYMTSGFPTLVGKRICLLIAHPDDEAMFFSPTLLSLSRPELQNRIFILCLSSGDADGLGHIRKTELAKSALLLGIPSTEQVVVVDDERFPDSMTQHWEAKEVAKVLQHYFAPKMKTMSADAAPTAMIDALITFDESGVSSHPNHISLYHGASTFLRNLMQRHSGWESPVKLYTLTSTNVVRKYGSVVDAMVTVLVSLVRKKRSGDFPTPMLAVSGVGGLRKAQMAMTSAHKSQMRWFRWGWIGVSRYMVVNDLVKVKGL
jgi:N-acetylglucosaminylphosphatidylinositol deacetylase